MKCNIEKVMYFDSDWSSSYSFECVFYKSGRTRIYKNWNDFPKTVKEYLKGKHTSNPKRDEQEGFTAYTYK